MYTVPKRDIKNLKIFYSLTGQIFDREVFDPKLVREEDLLQLVINYFSSVIVYFLADAKQNGKLKGQTSEERYGYFVDEFVVNGKILLATFELFPKIWQSFIKDAQNFEKEILDIKTRYLNDQDLLIQTGIINQTSSIKAINFLGDFHNGVAVAEVSLQNEKKIIYKPKNIENEVFLSKIVSLTNSFLPKNYQNLVSNQLSRTNYGWVQPAEKHDLKVEQVKNYYLRLGELLSITYLLDLSDIHFENLISNGEYPVLIDAEVLFSNNLLKPTNLTNAQQKVNNRIASSVVASGLLPIKDNLSLLNGDTSGFMGGEFQTEQRMLINIGRDDMMFERRVIRTSSINHLPSSNGQTYMPSNYVNEIVFGFELMYRTFLEHKSELVDYVHDNASKIHSRILVRDTKEYGILLKALNSPSFSENRNMILNKINQFSMDQQKPFNESEISQLNMGSIPYFQQTFLENQITDYTGNSVIKVINTPQSVFKSKIRKLSDKDLHEQILFLKFSIQSIESLRVEGNIYDFSKFVLDDKDKSIKDAIANLIKLIMENAEFGSDGSVSWLNLTVGNYDEFEFQMTEHSLYSGIAGIALPFINIYEQTKNTEIKNLLKSIRRSLLIKQVDNDKPSGSFYNGRLGQLIVMHKLNKILNESNYNIKNELYSLISRVISKQDMAFDDVMSGYAGIIISIYENRIFSDKTRNYLIEKLGKIILNDVVTDDGGSYYWLPRDGSNLVNSSYAHGNSGIMTALLIVYSITRKEQYISAFRRSWDFEKKYKTKYGWQDLRREDNAESAFWCHGSTGLLSARIQWLRLHMKYNILNTDEMKILNSEINLAVDLIKDDGLKGNNFCLCHGVLGNVLVLSDWNNIIKSNELEILINTTIRRVSQYGLKYSWNCGYGTRYYSFGLMTGIAGILYVLTLSSTFSSRKKRNILGGK